MSDHLTLKQVISRIETLILAHRQINHFFFGEVAERLTNGDVSYPAVFADMIAGNIDKDDRLTTYNFEFYVCGLVNVAEGAQANEIEVMSDLTSIAEDIKAMLSYNDYKDWDISTSTDMEYLREEMEDLVLCVKLKIGIATRYNSDRCSVPAEGVTFETNNDMGLVQRFVYVGSGEEGNTLTAATLQNRTVLLLLKGDKTLVPSATEDIELLKENEYNHAPQTGALAFGTDIEKDQIVQALYR